MFPNLEKYKKNIKELVENGNNLLKILRGKDDNLLIFREQYEIWYSEALSLTKTILPDRLEDFKNYYENKRNDSLKKAITYTPPREEGLNFDHMGYIPAKQIDFAKSLFTNQLNIIKSCQKRFESSLFDIKQLVQADLFDSELETARELNKKGFSRGAGAIAGVVLEKHLIQVCDNRKIKITKKNPAINDLNQLLKDNGIVETKDWRFIQHLGDLRNLCNHNKSKEPKKEDVDELITGVEKISKIIF